jgi:hypothetical protein
LVQEGTASPEKHTFAAMGENLPKIAAIFPVRHSGLG